MTESQEQVDGEVHEMRPMGWRMAWLMGALFLAAIADAVGATSTSWWLRVLTS
jgi:hypothetical protein